MWGGQFNSQYHKKEHKTCGKIIETSTRLDGTLLVIPTLGKCSQENQEFEASLDT
jgi:hypothetical protein